MFNKRTGNSDSPKFQETIQTDNGRVNSWTWAVLAQLDEDNHKQVISYGGRVLNTAENNYTTCEIELLSVKWAIRQYRCYLYGVQVDFYTDHKPLVHLKSSKNPRERMLKWIMELEEYDITYHYRPGSENIQADVLSRIHEKVEDETLDWYVEKKRYHSCI